MNKNETVNECNQYILINDLYKLIELEDYQLITIFPQIGSFWLEDHVWFKCRQPNLLQ